MKKSLLFSRLLFVSWLFVPAVASAAEIAVTLPPLSGLVRMLDAEVDVMCLLPAGADPHNFQLTPRKIEALRGARMLVRASRDDGGWPLPPRHGDTLDIWPDIDHGWVSPAAVREALPAIADHLKVLHPERAAAIDSALGHALLEVDAVASEWREALAGLRASGVIMQHPSWRRLMDEMEVPVLNVLESGHHGHEHGAHELEHALEDLKSHPGALLLADAGHGNCSLEWLHDHGDEHQHGGEHAASAPGMVTLDALGECGEPWAAHMRDNIERVRVAHVAGGTGH